MLGQARVVYLNHLRLGKKEKCHIFELYVKICIVHQTINLFSPMSHTIFHAKEEEKILHNTYAKSCSEILFPGLLQSKKCLFIIMFDFMMWAIAQRNSAKI